MTPVQKIVDLVNKQVNPTWWRHTVRLGLNGCSFDENDHELLYKIALMEVGLIEKDELFESYNAAVSSVGFEVEDSSVSLASLGPVSNVSALTDGQEITFKPTGMTIIYGDNGAGKSSYTKILKNACLTRGDIPNIKGNVFKGNTSVSSAMLSVCINGELQEPMTWVNKSEPDPSLKSIRVFDMQSAFHYIAKEGVIEYRPAGLHLLDALTKACTYIAKKVTADSGKLKAIALPELNSTTHSAKFISTLNAYTTDDQLDKNCISTDELAELLRIRDELHTYKSKTPEQLKKEISDCRKRIEPLQKSIQSMVALLNDEALQNAKELFEDYAVKAKAAEILMKSGQNNYPLKNIGSDMWKSMWDAAEAYISTENPDQEFPTKQGESCPLCLQTVDNQTAERLLNFRSYMKNKTQKLADCAKQLWQEKISPIANITINLDVFEPVLDELEYLQNGCKQNIISLVKNLENRKKNIKSEVPNFEREPLDLTMPGWINDRVNNLLADELAVTDDESLALKILQLTERINELEARKLILDNKLNYLTEVARLKKLMQVNAILDKTATQQITRLSSQINQETVIGELEKAFISELQHLGFKHFQVEAKTRGSLGSQLFKIRLENATTENILDIASEGEQKCLALASFLAEIHADNRRSAVIFDDPVNSMDHKWRRKFARRLAQESNVRQVVVFTHDLPFLKMLEESSNGDATVKALTRRGQEAGFVLERPPWDALKTASRIGLLTQEVVRLKKIAGESDEAYLQAAKSFYGKKRETWERLIEEWLIKGVVERFSRNVQTQNTRYLIDIEQSDVDLITNAMSKCSSHFEGHDNADELGVDIPDVDEVDKDLQELANYFTSLKKRRQ
ncbi:MAG: AAA family ATPase [Methylotenera sp.]